MKKRMIVFILTVMSTTITLAEVDAKNYTAFVNGDGSKVCEFTVDGGAKFVLDENELRLKIGEGEKILKVMSPPPQVYVDMLRMQKNCLAELTSHAQ